MVQRIACREKVQVQTNDFEGLLAMAFKTFMKTVFESKLHSVRGIAKLLLGLFLKREFVKYLTDTLLNLFPNKSPSIHNVSLTGVIQTHQRLFVLL